MKQAVLAVLVILGLTVRAHAEDPPPLDQFLEQRVAEELATDGVLLSRLGVHLEVEIIGDKLLVSLVEASTNRAAASTKIDAIPPDREATVAAVTQVAAALAAQLTSTRPAVPEAARTDTTAAALKDALAEERNARRAKEQAEYRFRQEAIYFGDAPVFFTDFKTFAAAGVKVVPYQGEMHRKIDGPEFYEIVGRPDLAARYRSNRRWGWIAMLGGAAVTLTGTVMLAKGDMDARKECYFPNPSSPLGGDYRPCNTGHGPTIMKYSGLALLLGGAGAMIYGGVRIVLPHPTSERERYELAAGHNAKLRKKYGLPVSSRPRRHYSEVAVAPYLVGDSAGLVLSGRF